jgi:unsaturated rhamnogalacturonyl hydrolase
MYASMLQRLRQRRAQLLLSAALAMSGCGEAAKGEAGFAAAGTSSAGQAPVANTAGTATSGGGGASAGQAGGDFGGVVAGAASSAGTSSAAGGGLGGAGASGAAAGGAPVGGATGLSYPARADLIEVLARVNQQFADKWPDTSAPLPGNRPSNIWTRGVYYEGLMALYRITQSASYRSYALDWAKANAWALRSPATNADNQCAGQTYLELYELDAAADKTQIAAVLASADAMVKSSSSSDWTWVDAIQMSMPVFAKLGVLTADAAYFTKMYALYSHTRNDEGGGLYDTKAHLWWRDAKWKPDQQLTPSGKNVYWSRGNGWAFAALARVLDKLPEDAPNRGVYLADFVDMAEALRAVQRADGLWNPSLADAAHFGGPELSGTALFTFGMAWGIRRGVLAEATYANVVNKAWQGMLDVSVHPNGFLGYVQSSGEDPSDGQPLSFDGVPDFEDFGVGCFLLAGSALAELSGRP